MKKAENRVLTFLLSEEHRSIPLSELLSILASEKVSYKLLSNKGPLVRIEISGNLKEICDRISYRASMLKLIIKELVYLRTFDLSNLRKILLKRDLSFLQNKSFYVRIIKKGECDVRHSSTEIESAIGSYIIQSVSKAKVNFESPDFILVGVLYDNTLSLGVLLKSVKRGTFLSRSPRKRPFFMSSALDVYTSRVMVNLAKAGSDSLIFDPFAGTGGILI
ncbi:MAG TPA: hypothetical protein ENF87_02965, partial [Thermoproteales archaeon]|nr:hypothetical protein [Thermoproteales archaeon]